MLPRALATLTLLLLLAQLSGGWWGRPNPLAGVRLSWRTNGEEIKVPHAQATDLPAHMRMPAGQDFDVIIRPYQLRLRVDGNVRVDRRVTAPGWRHDRPLSVFEELDLTPGWHDLELEWIPEGKADPPPSFHRRLDFRAGRIVLIQLRELGWTCLE